ncbi:MAG: glycosyltransferase family 2 protein [Acidobacteria bacterium]|nr:glycosyltransferase family 2 protein [Acidobacteriota bacterium]
MSASIGVVIVSYHSAECVAACVRSVLLHFDEVVVVDNGSTDASAGQARSVPVPPGKQVDVWEAGRNLGFAGGVNAGVRRLTTPNILVLNPDVELPPDTPIRRALEEALALDGVGAAAGVLRESGLGPQAGFTVRMLPRTRDLVLEALGINALWPSNPANVRYRCLDLDLHQAQDVEQPAGALVAFRREAWEQVGGWDEQFYPVWFEDVDFCCRLLANGWKIRLAPEARALHKGGHSVGKLLSATRASYWYGSLLRYSAKHFGPWRTRVVAAAVLLGTTGRMFVHSLHRRREAGGVFTASAGIAARCLMTGRAPSAPAGGSPRANQGFTTRHLHGL